MQVNTIEQIIFGYAIQYRQLASMVESTFKNSKYANCDKVNLYIDLTKIIRACSNIEFTKLELSAGILNLCAHYKAFFNSGFGVYCNIYMIYSTGDFILNKYNYRNYSYSNNDPKYWETDKDIKANKEALKVICKYLNNVEYLETTEEVALYIMDIAKVDNPNNGIPNIVISKDLYLYQLPAINDSYYIFRPRKVSGEDKSYVVNNDNIYDMYQTSRHIVSTAVDKNINPMLLPVFMTMCGFPDRCVKSKLNFKTLMKALCSLINNGSILNSYQPIITEELILNISKYTSAKLDAFEISCTYNSINLVSLYTKYEHMPSTDKYHGKINLIDPDGLISIVREWYNSMIDIDTLCL